MRWIGGVFAVAASQAAIVRDRWVRREVMAEGPYYSGRSSIVPLAKLGGTS